MESKNYHTVKIFIIFLSLTFASLSSCTQKEKQLAETPPMGWNSWDCLGMEMNEDEIKAAADYMAKHLKQYGYEYIVLDMGWNFGEGLGTNNFHSGLGTPNWKPYHNPPQFMDEYGRLIPNPKRFPSSVNGKGLKPLADYIHSVGLKFGIHIMRGIPWQAVEQNTPIKGTLFKARDIYTDSTRCVWFEGMKTVDMTKPGAQEYYDSLLELYTEWGVDFIKADDIINPYRIPEIEAFYKAVQKTGRRIVINLSAYAPFDFANHVSEHANMWRITGDMWDAWVAIDHTFKVCRQWQKYIKPGHWPDCDMIPIGKLRMNGTDGALAYFLNIDKESTINEFSRLTEDEKQTIVSLWSIFRSPLMIGGYLPELTPSDFDLLTNKEVLAINQASINNRELRFSEKESVWTADSPDRKTMYLALFNTGEEPSIPIQVTWQELGISGKYKVRDLWKKKDLDVFDQQVVFDVNRHGCVLLALKKK